MASMTQFIAVIVIAILASSAVAAGVSIMIPGINGFVVLFGGSLGKHWQIAQLSPDLHVPWKIAGVST